MVLLCSYDPAPVINPNGVPFDPNMGEIVFAHQYEPNQLQLRIKVADDGEGLTGACSEGVLSDPAVIENEWYEYEYIWTYEPNVGMHYIDFTFSDGELSKSVMAVIYVPEGVINQPPVVISITEYVPVSWLSPLSVSDPNNTWSNESNVLDGDS